MSAPREPDVADALAELVDQFADPLVFLRELVQNAMDAYKWLLLAAWAKHPGAAENLAAMESRLNEGERRSARAAAGCR